MLNVVSPQSPSPWNLLPDWLVNTTQMLSSDTPNKNVISDFHQRCLGFQKPSVYLGSLAEFEIKDHFECLVEVLLRRSSSKNMCPFFWFFVNMMWCSCTRMKKNMRQFVVKSGRGAMHTLQSIRVNNILLQVARIFLYFSVCPGKLFVLREVWAVLFWLFL